MKGMSISTCQEADEFLEDYDEGDDEVFEPKYNAKKVLTKKTKKSLVNCLKPSLRLTRKQIENRLYIFTYHHCLLGTCPW